MRVGFNGTSLAAEGFRGWSRYTSTLIKHLSQLGVDIYVYSDRELNSQFLPKSAMVRERREMRYSKWLFWQLSKDIKQDNIEVYHCPMNYGVPPGLHCPSFLTLHDCIEFIYSLPQVTLKEKLSIRHIRWLIWMKSSLYFSDRIITVSEYSKRDIVRHLGVNKDRIDVIYEAADCEFNLETVESDRKFLQKFSVVPRKYILYVGGFDQRKNIEFLIRAFFACKSTSLHLILGGGGDSRRLQQLCQSLNIEGRIVFTGYIDDATLAALYRQALCFVYPSLYEGFGLQICEAMACGCPVLVSDQSCLPEILSDGGEIFSIDSTQQLTSMIDRLSQDEAYWKKLQNMASRRSQEFSWRRTANETFACYQNLIKSNYRRSIRGIY